MTGTPAILGALEPAPSDLSQSKVVDDLVVMMTLTPGRAGYNELNVMYFDTDGGEGLGGATFVLSYLDFGDIRLEQPATEGHSGHAVLSGEHFRHAGRWRVAAQIHREGAQDTVAEFDVGIGGALNQPQ
ncbi:MAG TPA: hypothetical protein VJB57_07565 [Dehalococcoidia bacterium]|nr:hypothetical protein [Dehalococcoidia bacterium]